MTLLSQRIIHAPNVQSTDKRQRESAPPLQIEKAARVLDGTSGVQIFLAASLLPPEIFHGR